MTAVQIKKGDQVIAKNVLVADNFFTRAKGLMFSENLGENDGLLIEPCNSIHTFFMNYPLDIVFLDSENKVVKAMKNLKPWRMTRMYFSAHKVLEMMGGSLTCDLRAGERLDIECIS